MLKKFQKEQRNYMSKRPKITYKFKKNGRYYDKVEKTKEYKQCIEEVEKLAEIEAIKIVGERSKGYCHIYWACKKKILKEKFNIDWRTPSEMNPNCKFD